MPYFNKERIVPHIILLLSYSHIYSQNTCPPNLDFEDGNFGNWVCQTGLVSVGPNGQNTINFTGTGQVANRHTIIASSDTSRDFYGGFKVVCPNNSGFSVKLGNSNVNSECEGISYTYTIPNNATNFSILYQYAVVFQNPGHDPEQQPRFRAWVLNLTDGDTINCVSFDFTSSANLPGFNMSPRDNQVLYKDWTPISLNLSGYAGKTIRLEFITSDCTLGAHFGYAYVDVNSSCDGSVVGSTVCVADTTVNLTAPYGFQSYKWFQDNTFSTVIGTGQVLTFSPAPNVGSVFPVIVTPYPGFGCVDTVYARIVTENKPISDAGADVVTTCRWVLNPIGTTPNPLWSYLWTPANLVSNSRIANPGAFMNTFSPTQFVVKTTSKSSGCFSYDTVMLYPTIIDTTLLVAGKTNYCIGDTYNTTLTVVNQSTAIQWLSSNIPITGETNHNYVPTNGGSYRAKFVQIGCTDTTRAVQIIDHPHPLAVYTINKDSQCVTNNSFTFTNGSSIQGTDLLSYLWKFGDGSTSQINSPVKIYALTGRFPVDLIVSSDQGCAATASKFVEVFPNIAAGFKWNTPCTNVPIQFINQTNENGSILVNYLWDLGNGNTSTLKDPIPFLYPAAGAYKVSLTAVSLGCETASQSIDRTVQVFEPLPGIRYRDVTIPINYSSKIYARGGVGTVFNWKPSTQLSSANTYAPYFYAANNVKYLVDITDQHQCITTDTLQVYVLKNKGFYMPNAFTPNKDGHNDEIMPWLVDMKSLKRFNVYNRFGNLLFSTEKDGRGWDGTYKGVAMEAGAYVWLIEYVDTDGQVKMEKGTLMLVR